MTKMSAIDELLPIMIEAEDPQNPNSMLRVVAGGLVRGESLTAAEAHILIGELLEKLFPPAQSQPKF